MKDDFDIIKLNRKAWDNAAKSYDKEFHGKIHTLFDYFCDKLPKGGYILDLGSGTGLPYAKLLIEKGFKVLGIDLSAEMIKIARKNVPKAKFKEISMTNLNYKEEFDGIFSSYSMLLLNPQLFKETAKRIVQGLKKGGIFYLCINGPWIEGADLDKDVIIEFKGEKMYSRPYSKEEILNIFVPLGMKLLKFEKEIITSETWGKENMNTYIFRLE
ncbi:MAG: class I SAM-dependent methyltransferase [Candidatus Lokiarchaeota archaeon]|nr:class I SAM-dependent methyltransferase [Candidatus Lokiarchaeota archaeon]